MDRHDTVAAPTHRHDDDDDDGDDDVEPRDTAPVTGRRP
jgi:hypothetical protein